MFEKERGRRKETKRIESRGARVQEQTIKSGGMIHHRKCGTQRISLQPAAQDEQNNCQIICVTRSFRFARAVVAIYKGPDAANYLSKLASLFLGIFP